MRKTISLLGWLGVALTIFTLVLTLLTTYQFTYFKYFDSYHTLQGCMVFTMLAWAASMFDLRSSLKSTMYPIGCIVIAIGTIFFIFMNVY